MDLFWKIVEWIESRYEHIPLGWSHAQFHCFEDLPEDLRSLIMIAYFQDQIENGGPAQLLFNAFNHWRTLLSSCMQAFQKMGLFEEAQAVARYEVLFARYADECKRFIRTRLPDGTQGDFVGFMNAVGKEMETSDEKLFYSWSGLLQRVEQYVERNREHFLSLKKTIPPREG